MSNTHAIIEFGQLAEHENAHSQKLLRLMISPLSVIGQPTQLPTVHFHPTMQESSQEWDLM